jgi:anti-sigma B factor antagonist
MTKSGNETRADRAAGVHILRVQGELDLATADALYQRGRAAIARHARLLLLDLRGLSFCDARGLSALVRMANDADAAGCRYGLIAPKPQVATVVRITGLGMRLRVFATIEQARQYLLTLAASRTPVSVASCG